MRNNKKAKKQYLTPALNTDALICLAVKRVGRVGLGEEKVTRVQLCRHPLDISVMTVYMHTRDSVFYSPLTSPWPL